MSSDCNNDPECYGFSWYGNPEGSVVTGTGCTIKCVGSEDYAGWGSNYDFYVKTPEDYNNFFMKYSEKVPNYGLDSCYNQEG